jgi:hypothetical protein
MNDLVQMNYSTPEYFQTLHGRYMTEVRKFLNALKNNTPRNELMIIRRDVKRLLAEIRRHPANR